MGQPGGHAAYFTAVHVPEQAPPGPGPAAAQRGYRLRCVVALGQHNPQNKVANQAHAAQVELPPEVVAVKVKNVAEDGPQHQQGHESQPYPDRIHLEVMPQAGGHARDFAVAGVAEQAAGLVGGGIVGVGAAARATE